MQPGALTLEGFLGTDDRDLEEILRADDEAVRDLGLSHARIAAELEELTELAREGFGTPCDKGHFKVVLEEPLGGWVQCPYEHRRFRKGEVTLTNINNGKSIVWTPMQVHMIGEHGFYEGRGSRYRLEPEEIKKVLEL